MYKNNHDSIISHPEKQTVIQGFSELLVSVSSDAF